MQRIQNSLRFKSQKDLSLHRKRKDQLLDIDLATIIFQNVTVAHCSLYPRGQFGDDGDAWIVGLHVPEFNLEMKNVQILGNSHGFLVGIKGR